jgi:hypothetical protein
MANYLNHARHNKEASEYLHKAEADGFPDWVITTAFYSAIHYSYSIIFPFTEGASTFTVFDDYYKLEKRSGSDKSKHDVTHDLIRKFHLGIEPQFAQLKSAAQTSRYLDYQQHPSAVKRIRKCLSVVSEYCEKKIIEKIKKEEAKK